MLPEQVQSLVERYYDQGGEDNATWGQLFSNERLQPYVLRRLRRQFDGLELRNEVEAVYAEAWVRVEEQRRKGNRCKDAGKFRAYLWKVAFAVACEYAKPDRALKSINLDEVHDEYLVSQSDDPLEDLQWSDDLALLSEFRSQLSPHLDEAILLLLEGLTEEEAASFLRIPLGTAKSRRSRAKKKLRELRKERERAAPVRPPRRRRESND